VLGRLLDRVLGVYLILFGAMVDLFVFQNPLATDTPVVAQALPGHYPVRVTMEAAFLGHVTPLHLAAAVAALAALVGAATLSLRQTTRVG
jgi:hypothetical protein